MINHLVLNLLFDSFSSFGGKKYENCRSCLRKTNFADKRKLLFIVKNSDEAKTKRGNLINKVSRKPHFVVTRVW